MWRKRKLGCAVPVRLVAVWVAAISEATEAVDHVAVPVALEVNSVEALAAHREI